jgi:hypothetical protein
VFRAGFLGGEVFDELDHLETLSRRKLQKRSEQAQAFDGAACWRAELEVQFSRETEVFHLAPMNLALLTSIGLCDQTSRTCSKPERRNRVAITGFYVTTNPWPPHLAD